MSKTFDELLSRISSFPRKTVSVSNAQDKEVLEAVMEAKAKDIADAILVGNEEEIRAIASEIGMDLGGYRIINETDVKTAALKAVELVHNHEADILLKGLVPTGTFLKSVLDKEVGLRSGKLLSHVCVVEFPGSDRLFFMTDVAFNTYPGVSEKADIIRNSVEVAKACGIDCPKVAPLCSVEVLNPKMQPTVDAAELTAMNERGEITGCQVYGPLSMDLAMDPEAAVHKGIDNPVAGHADIFLFPNIDAGNIAYKLLVRTPGVKNGNVLVGTTAPVVLTSRSDSAQVKVNSIALACIIASSITE